MMDTLPKTGVSNTFVPYFDNVLKDEDKFALEEVKMAPMVSDKVKTEAIRALMKKDSMVQSTKLLKTVPNKVSGAKSEIMNEFQISTIIDYFPSLYKSMNWKLLYSLNRDGVSLQTFFEKCKKQTTTLLVIRDTNKWVFGGFCTEAWRPSGTKFFGTGENFLFTFKNRNTPIVYKWTGVDD